MQVLPPLRKWTTGSYTLYLIPTWDIVVGRHKPQRPRRRPRPIPPKRLERPLLPLPRREPTLIVIFYQHTWMTGSLFAQGYKNYETRRHPGEANRQFKQSSWVCSSLVKYASLITDGRHQSKDESPSSLDSSSLVFLPSALAVILTYLVSVPGTLPLPSSGPQLKRKGRRQFHVSLCLHLLRLSPSPEPISKAQTPGLHGVTHTSGATPKPSPPPPAESSTWVQ